MNNTQYIVGGSEKGLKFCLDPVSGIYITPESISEHPWYGADFNTEEAEEMVKVLKTLISESKKRDKNAS